ncbi:MAG: AsmA family protein, partial [Gammaproteobacteria bacterium]|nr:AsmA family protein [Gammaproteobacteria bacterium]
MRTLLKVAGVLVGLFLLLIAGAYWYVSTLDISEYREEIAQKVEEVTGRKLRLAGDMSLEVFPSPSLVVEDAALANAEWAKQPDFVRIKRVEAEVSLAQLFAGKVTVSRIAVIDPVIALETDESGRNNWTLGAAPEAAPERKDEGSALKVDVSNVEVRGGKLSYIDGVAKRSAMVGIDELLITPSGWLKPLVISLKGNAVVSNAAWGSQPEFVNIGQLEAKISMSDWSGSGLKIERLALERPAIFLETSAEGQNNWTLADKGPGEKSESEGDKPLPFDLVALEVRDGNFSYRDGIAKTTRVVVVDELQINAQSDETLDVNLRAKVDQRELKIQGKTGSLASLFGNKPYAFDLNLGAAGAEVAAEGSLERPLDARGVKASLKVKASNVGEMMRTFGVVSDLSSPLEASAALRELD